MTPWPCAKWNWKEVGVERTWAGLVEALPIFKLPDASVATATVLCHVGEGGYLGDIVSKMLPNAMQEASLKWFFTGRCWRQRPWDLYGAKSPVIRIFPISQVRVVRLSSFSFSFSPSSSSPQQLPALDGNNPQRTSTASSRWQRSPPDLHRSTASRCDGRQCSPPDPNRRIPMTVFPITDLNSQLSMAVLPIPGLNRRIPMAVCPPNLNSQLRMAVFPPDRHGFKCHGPLVLLLSEVNILFFHIYGWFWQVLPVISAKLEIVSFVNAFMEAFENDSSGS